MLLCWQALLEPWSYILGVPGKNVRGTLIKCFQDWMAIDTDKLVAISTIVRDLHTASLLYVLCRSSCCYWQLNRSA